MKQHVIRSIISSVVQAIIITTVVIRQSEGCSTNAREQGVLEARLEANYFYLQKNLYESKISYIVLPLERSLEKMKKHRPIADLAVSPRQRKDWLSAANMVLMLIHVSTGNHSNIAELEKADQLIECLAENSIRNRRSFDPNLRFRFPEQSPDPLIRSGEEKINHFLHQIQELNKLADEAA